MYGKRDLLIHLHIYFLFAAAIIVTIVVGIWSPEETEPPDRGPTSQPQTTQPGPRPAAQEPPPASVVRLDDKAGRVENLRAQEAIPVLKEALKDKDERVRKAAAEALGRIGPSAKAALPALRKALRDEEEDVREAAAEALRKIRQKGPTTASTRPGKGS